jgi:tetratricopeptide (TPR) repeat protein
MKQIFLKSFFLILVATAQAQQVSPQLTEQYFQNGEYEKALDGYEKLSQQNQGDYFFDRYVQCLVNLERYEQGEKVLLKQIKKEPHKVALYVTFGTLYERQNKPEKAEEQYKKAWDKLPTDRFVISNLAETFNATGKYDWAIKTYEKGSQLLKNKHIYAFNLAELYNRQGETAKMVDMYLNSLVENPQNVLAVEAMFQRTLKPEEMDELQTQLYARAQDEPKNVVYPELLSWLFLQKKDYKNAFRQLKSLDRLTEEDGQRVFHLAEIAENDKDYDAALDGYQYIISDKGKNSQYYIESQKNLLGCKRKRLTDGYTFTPEELKQIEKEYEVYLNDAGRNMYSAPIVQELAELEAFYLNNLDKAIELLQQLLGYGTLDRYVQARAKLALGDFYLMKGENWESTLLYSQVDKAFKDDIMGHEARFRNAKLSYYTGDFDWSKTQFGVLKASTSKLISNDAIDMDVFIMDNMGTDSTGAALEYYAQAELLVFQNRFPEAFAKLDTLQHDFAGNALEDDIHYLKAKVYVKKKQYEEAVKAYQMIIEKYATEIRADNALYELAELYETRLNDKKKAKDLYEKLFTDFSSSTLAVEARKKFRQLRGDANVN